MCGARLLVFFGRGGGAIRHRDLDGAAGPLDAILEIFFNRLVFRALRAERVGQTVVPLVAFVREDLPAIEWRQRQRHRERLGVHDWIVHRELILEDISRHALEPFGDHHLVAVAQLTEFPLPPMLVLSVRFVVTTTSSSPSHRARESPRYCRMPCPRWEHPCRCSDPCVVDHLVAERHHARRLHDTVAVAVDDAKHGTDDAARDAAIVEREVFGRIEGTLTERTAIARGTALLGFLRDCWAWHRLADRR